MGTFPIWLLAILISSALCGDKVSLLTQHSYKVLKNDAWRIGEDDVIVAVSIKPQTLNGRIFTAYAAKDEVAKKVAYELEVSLDNGNVNVDLYDNDRQKLLEKPFSTNIIDTTHEHSIAVKINANQKVVSYRVNSNAEIVSEIISDTIDINNTQLMIELGCANKSVIGCVSLDNVQTGKETADPAGVVVVEEARVSICAEDVTCETRDCGKGRCLPLEIPTCDCYGTGKSGPNCRSEIPTVSLDNDDDHSLWYVPLANDQQPKIIALDFKFTSDELEGVIFFGNLSSGSPIKLYVVDKDGDESGILDFGDYGQLEFNLAKPEGFHTVRLALFFDLNYLTLNVDGIEQKLRWHETPKQEIKILELIFGQSAHTVGANDLGFTGCLRNVYVDHLDIIERLRAMDPRVASDKDLPSCEQQQPIVPYPPVIAAGMFQLSEKNPDEGDEIVILQKEKEMEEDPEDDVIVHHKNKHLDDINFRPTRKTEKIIEFVEKGESEVKTADLFPVPAKEKKPKVAMCDRSFDFLCKHNSQCAKSDGVGKCICREGYSGKYCQFSLFPRTCAESHLFFDNPNGPTFLDVDGSGPLDVSVAQCDGARTSIPNDMPNNTVVRDNVDLTHALFQLSYRDFSEPKLAALIAQSEECEQFVEYDCSTAPIGFENDKTWFLVASGNKTVTQIGKTKNECECASSPDKCVHKAKCNCDARGISKDVGRLHNKHAGITKIIALHAEGDVNGKMTVGELKCAGFAGAGAVRFSAPAVLQTADWKGVQFGFQFRTAQPAATIATIHDDDLHNLQIKLTGARRISVIWKHEDLEVDTSVETQFKLNDTKWHQIIVEVLDNQLRLTVDSLSAYSDVQSDLIPKKILQLGHLSDGFIGCVRSVFVNNELVDLHSYAKTGARNVLLGCADRCTPTFCQNSGDCIEDFEKNAPQCICKYPMIQSGASCEIDINKESSVSFHGGFLKYEGLHANALTEQLVLSARTDQPKALLFFAHDHDNNFLQIHISDEVNVTLTLNNRDVVYTCTVTARQGAEYSDMQWIQLVVRHDGPSSTLTVNEDSCTIYAERILAKTPIQQFNNVTSDFVTIPVGLQSPTDPQPFLYVFVGGVERDTHSFGGQKRLLPVYQSSIPDLLGCMRGLRIGSAQVDLRHTTNGYRPADPNLVRIGCDMRCGDISCMHGGHCSVGWLNYDPAAHKTTCDCSRTSYAGSTCNLDDGIRLDGKTFILFRMGEILAKYIDKESKFPQLFKFAFSASSPSVGKQNLATIYFDDKSRFEVILNKNGTINVGLRLIDRGVFVKTFKGNFSDGYRHFVVAEFSAKQATAVMIDSVREDFDFQEDGNLDLFNANDVVVGKQLNKNDSFYQGCISNIDINYQKGETLHFTPLGYLGNVGNSKHEYVDIDPPQDVHKISCANFENPEALPVHQNTVEFPVWETNFARRVYNYDGPSPDKTEPESWFNWMYLVLIIVILLLILLVFAVLIYCCCCRSKDKDNKDVYVPDEEAPLRPLPRPVTPTTPTKARNNFELPDPDRDLETETNSWAGSDADDFDRTLTDYDEGEVPRPEELPLNTTRTAPIRMSSFRGGRTSPGAPLFTGPPPPQRSPKPVPPPRLSPKL